MSLAQILHVLSRQKAAKSKIFAKVKRHRRFARALGGSAGSGTSSLPVMLRELSESDFQNWQQAYSMLRAPMNDWDEGPWKQSELTRAKFQAVVREQKRLKKADQQYTYGVFRVDDGVFVGFVSLMDVSRGIFQNAYLGYRIFNPYWGQGYATYAVCLALELAFTDLKLHRVEAGISPENPASIQVAVKAGLRCEGLSRRRLLVHRKWVDLLLFAGTCEDYGYRFLKD